MKYFVELSPANIVIRKTVSGDDTTVEDIKKIMKSSNEWKETDKTTSIKDTWDNVNNVFIKPQPYPSWTLDSNFKWQPPVPEPQDIVGQVIYKWNEESQQWDNIATQV